MSRVVFVTGSAGGVGVGNLQHRVPCGNRMLVFGNMLDTTSRRSAEVIAATMWRNFVCFLLKTRYNRPRNLRLPALPERENLNMHGDTQSPCAIEEPQFSICTNRM
jgi:hypothetical protein